MKDVVLDVQNVTQKIDTDDLKIKSFGQRLREAAGDSYKQEKLPNGDVKITMVIPAKIPGVKNE